MMPNPFAGGDFSLGIYLNRSSAFEMRRMLGGGVTKSICLNTQPLNFEGLI